MDMTSLSCAMWGEGEGKEEGTEENQEAKGPKTVGNKNIWIIWEEPLREGQPSL